MIKLGRNVGKLVQNWIFSAMIDVWIEFLPKAEVNSRHFSPRHLEELVDSMELPAVQPNWFDEQLEWSARELERLILRAFQAFRLKLIEEEEEEQRVWRKSAERRRQRRQKQKKKKKRQRWLKHRMRCLDSSMRGLRWRNLFQYAGHRIALTVEWLGAKWAVACAVWSEEPKAVKGQRWATGHGIGRGCLPPRMPTGDGRLRPTPRCFGRWMASEPRLVRRWAMRPCRFLFMNKKTIKSYNKWELND